MKQRSKELEKLAEKKAKKMADGGMPTMNLAGVSGYADGGQVDPTLAGMSQSIPDYNQLTLLDKIKMAAQGIDPMTGKPKQMADGGQVSPSVAPQDFLDAFKRSLGVDSAPAPEKSKEDEYEEIRKKNRQQFGGN